MKKTTFKEVKILTSIIAVVAFSFNVESQHCAVTGEGAYNANAVSTTGGATNISYAGGIDKKNYI